MYQNNKILAVIPARGGSKGIVKKNVRHLAGKPLIAWTIKPAKKSKYIDRLILSSDDSEIIKTAKKFNCEVPFVRPYDLSQDNTPGILPVLHAVEKIKGFDYVMLLQPTSPLRTSYDIDRCIEWIFEKEANACVSVCESSKSPYGFKQIDAQDRLIPIFKDLPATRRQDLPKTYVLNGALYIANVNWLLKSKDFVTEETLAFHMPIERSIDIDMEFDLKVAEFLIRYQENYI